MSRCFLKILGLLGYQFDCFVGRSLLRTEHHATLKILGSVQFFSGLGRIAGILCLEVEDPDADMTALQRVGSELAMHVVASKPLFLSKELVSTEALESEREILRSQVLVISCLDSAVRYTFLRFVMLSFPFFEEAHVTRVGFMLFPWLLSTSVCTGPDLFY